MLERGFSVRLLTDTGSSVPGEGADGFGGHRAGVRGRGRAAAGHPRRGRPLRRRGPVPRLRRAARRQRGPAGRLPRRPGRGAGGGGRAGCASAAAAAVAFVLDGDDWCPGVPASARPVGRRRPDAGAESGRRRSDAATCDRARGEDAARAGGRWRRGTATRSPELWQAGRTAAARERGDGRVHGHGRERGRPMSGRARLAVCAAAATLMAACALLPLVDSGDVAPPGRVPAGWSRRCGRAGPAGAAGPAADRGRAGAGDAAAADPGLRPRSRRSLGIVPGPGGLPAASAALLQAGGDDVGQYAIPAPLSDGIRLMLVGGVLLIGLAVDALAVTYRSAAPAGLPLLALYSVAAGLAGGGARPGCGSCSPAAGYLLLLLAEGRDRLSQWGRVFGGAAARARPAGPPRTAPVGARCARAGGSARWRWASRWSCRWPCPPWAAGCWTARAAARAPARRRRHHLRGQPAGLAAGQPEPAEDRAGADATAPNAEDDPGPVSADRRPGRVRRHGLEAVGAAHRRTCRPCSRRRAGSAADVRRPAIRTTHLGGRAGTRRTGCRCRIRRARCDISGRWRYEPEGRTLVGDHGQTTRGVQYEVTSLLVRADGRAAGRRAGAAGRICSASTPRCPDSLPAVVADTARQVTEGAANDYERAVKLQDWFAVSGGFTYNTQVQAGSGSDAIARFLQDKEGFCVHFSFAMAAMARTLGIPARVAVGFTPGTPQADGTMSVGLQGRARLARAVLPGRRLDPLRADAEPRHGARATPSPTRPRHRRADPADSRSRGAVGRAVRGHRRPRRAARAQLRRSSQACREPVPRRPRSAPAATAGRLARIVGHRAGRRCWCWCCRCCRCCGGSGSGPGGSAARPQPRPTSRRARWPPGGGDGHRLGLRHRCRTSRRPRGKAAGRIVRLGRLDRTPPAAVAPRGDGGGAGALRAASAAGGRARRTTCGGCGPALRASARPWSAAAGAVRAAFGRRGWRPPRRWTRRTRSRRHAGRNRRRRWFRPVPRRSAELRGRVAPGPGPDAAPGGTDARGARAVRVRRGRGLAGARTGAAELASCGLRAAPSAGCGGERASPPGRTRSAARAGRLRRAPAPQCEQAVPAARRDVGPWRSARRRETGAGRRVRGRAVRTWPDMSEGGHSTCGRPLPCAVHESAVWHGLSVTALARPGGAASAPRCGPSSTAAACA